jgi:fucose permease
MTIIYVCLALIGYGNSNIFPIILSEALLYMPSKKNEVSGLMIMGLFGGTIFPLLMGTLSDTLGSQIGAVIILLVGAVYLSIFVSRLKTNPN